MAGETSITEAGCTLHTFERNRYFYGKLLTVRDFETEQRYMNGKRQLLNRLLHGVGTVCGLQVTAQGDTGIVLSPGVALDCCGREIVVSQEYTRSDISELPGYPATLNGGKTLYLCLAYTECLREPVSAIADPSTCEEACEYNRIQESFALSLTETPPERHGGSACARREEIFVNSQVRIERVAPRWVNPKDLFEVRLIVTARQNIASLSVVVGEQIPPELSVISGLPASHQMAFALSALAEGASVEQTYLLRAGDSVGSAVIDAQVQIGGGAPQPATTQSTVEIVTGSLSDRIVETYFSEELDECPSCEGDECIALAALTLDGTGRITQIEMMPQAQYVYSGPMLYELIACAERRLGQIPTVAVDDDGAEVLPVASRLNFGPGLDATDAGAGQADISANVGNGLQIVGDQIQPDYSTADEAGKVVEANDPRLSDARTPLPHAPTHQDGGSDEIDVTGLSGVLADAQLVEVQRNGAVVATRRRLNFIGPGFTVNDAPAQERVNIRVQASEYLALRYVGGDGQQVAPGGTLPCPLIVGVENQDGVPQADVKVALKSTTGDDVLTDRSDPSNTGPEIVVTTDGEGLAQVTWKVNEKLGCHQVIAALESPPQATALLLVFEAVVTTGGPDEQPTTWPTVERITWPNDQVMPLDQLNGAGLRVVFSEPMDAATITDDTFIVTLELPWRDPFTEMPGHMSFIVHGELVRQNQRTWRFRPQPQISQDALARWIEAEKEMFDGTSIRCRVTLKGDHILAADQVRPLDGDVFARVVSTPAGAPISDLVLPSGNGERGGDFESWFYLELQ